VFLSLLGIGAVSTEVKADPWYWLNNEGYHDLQVNGAIVYATGVDEWWLDPEPGFNENDLRIDLVYHLYVDGVPVSTFYGPHEDGWWEGSETISRDPNNPDIVPFSIQHSLSPGQHRVELVCEVVSEDFLGQPHEGYAGPSPFLYSLVLNVTVP
jgi:hypothetical protein